LIILIILWEEYKVNQHNITLITTIKK
jgi:hypothetical protein